MTIWAQNFQIAQIVVAAVSIFMVHPKNVRRGVIATAFTRFKHAASKHVFSSGNKTGLPFCFGCFIDACFGAVFSFMRWRVQKLDAAMHACILCGAFARHRFVVARRRTVFGLVGSAGYVRERSAALLAVRNQLHSARKCKTLAATVQRSILAVRRDRKQDFALQASLIVPDTGAFCATH